MLLAKRIGIVVAIALFVLAGVFVVVFTLGKPTTTQVLPDTAAPAVASGGTAAPSDPNPTPASVPGDPSDPLAIEIPGCVCHSDDPQLVADHATRRMSECFECHQGGTPEMGQ